MLAAEIYQRIREVFPLKKKGALRPTRVPEGIDKGALRDGQGCLKRMTGVP